MKPRFKFKKIFVDSGTFEISPREKDILANMTPEGRAERIRQMRRARAVPNFAWERQVESMAHDIERKAEAVEKGEVVMNGRGRKKVFGRLDAVPPYLVEKRHTRRSRSTGRRD